VGRIDYQGITEKSGTESGLRKKRAIKVCAGKLSRTDPPLLSVSIRPHRQGRRVFFTKIFLLPLTALLFRIIRNMMKINKIRIERLPEI
jgi:hypothetical protein